MAFSFASCKGMIPSFFRKLIRYLSGRVFFPVLDLPFFPFLIYLSPQQLLGNFPLWEWNPKLH